MIVSSFIYDNVFDSGRRNTYYGITYFSVSGSNIRHQGRGKDWGGSSQHILHDSCNPFTSLVKQARKAVIVEKLKSEYSPF